MLRKVAVHVVFATLFSLFLPLVLTGKLYYFWVVYIYSLCLSGTQKRLKKKLNPVEIQDIKKCVADITLISQKNDIFNNFHTDSKQFHVVFMLLF